MVWCKQCQLDVEPVEDETEGFAGCPTCGLVVDTLVLEEGVQFGRDAGGGATVQGQFVSAEGRLRGFRGSEPEDSHEKSVSKGRVCLLQYAEQLQVANAQEHVDSAFRLYRLAVRYNFTRGRRTQWVAAACLYVALRQRDQPFMLIDLSDLAQVNVYVLGAVFLALCKCLHFDNQPLFRYPVDPSLFIHRFADQLRFSKGMTDTVAQTALRLIKSMKRDWMQTGRRPAGICGAALFIAAHLHGEMRTKREIVRVVHVGECTVKKRLSEFALTNTSDLTLTEFQEHCLAQDAQAAASSATMLQGAEDGSEDFQKQVTGYISISGGMLAGSKDPPAYTRGLKRIILDMLATGGGRDSLRGDEEEEEDEEEQAGVRQDGGADGGSGDGAEAGEERNTLRAVNDGLKALAGSLPGGEAHGKVGADDGQQPLLALPAPAEDTDAAGGGPERAVAETGSKRKTPEPECNAACRSRSRRDGPEPSSAATAASEADAGRQDGLVPQPAAAAASPQPAQAGGVGPTEALQEEALPGETLAEEEEQLQQQEEEETLSDVDDAEIEGLLVSEQEYVVRETLWTQMNKEYLEKQAHKKAVRAAAAAARQEAEGTGEDSSQRRAAGRAGPSKRQSESFVPGQTVVESVEMMLEQKKMSSKVNYDVLHDMFVDVTPLPSGAAAAPADASATDAAGTGQADSTTEEGRELQQLWESQAAARQLKAQAAKKALESDRALQARRGPSGSGAASKASPSSFLAGLSSFKPPSGRLGGL